MQRNGGNFCHVGNANHSLACDTLDGLGSVIRYFGNSHRFKFLGRLDKFMQLGGSAASGKKVMRVFHQMLCHLRQFKHFDRWQLAFKAGGNGGGVRAACGVVICNDTNGLCPFKIPDETGLPFARAARITGGHESIFYQRGNVFFSLGNKDCFACLRCRYEFWQPVGDRINALQIPNPFALRCRIGAALLKSFGLVSANLILLLAFGIVVRIGCNHFGCLRFDL